MRFWIIIAALFIGWCIRPDWFLRISPLAFTALTLTLVAGLIFDLFEWSKQE